MFTIREIYSILYLNKSQELGTLAADFAAYLMMF